MSSEMNACQAIVKPDCSKPKVQKSQGMQTALSDFLLQLTEEKYTDTSNKQDILQNYDFIYFGCKTIPDQISSSITMCTLEFAGVKFKANVISGLEYIHFIQNGILNRTMTTFPKLRCIAVCEEKYKLTPDDFKAATRNQRQVKKKISISHLKSGEDILNSKKFDKSSLVTTAEGKSLISTYLAMNAGELDFKRNIMIDIDSELNFNECTCVEPSACNCKQYSTPIRCQFHSNGEKKITSLQHIKQRKGEAEMAQIDWFMEYLPSLQQQEGCISIVTSGDIDSVILHMFSLSYLWPRKEDGTFRHPVYVILQKPGGLNDIYNVTKILTFIETSLKERYFGMKLAVVLSLGGNDFLPKFHGISHSSVLDVFVNNFKFRSDLFSLIANETKCQMNMDQLLFVEFVKTLYCPKRLDADRLTYDEVRQISVRIPTNTRCSKIRSPQCWMPPTSSIQRLARNVNCLIRYYFTAGKHGVDPPDFIRDGCLKKMENGDIEYDLGEDVHIKNHHDILTLPEEMLYERMRQASKTAKRKHELTPQKGTRRKRNLTSTPKARKPKAENDHVDLQ